MLKLHFKILPLLLIVWITLSCSPNYELKDLQTGITNFQITNDRKESKFSYPYFTKFQSIPQVAFAINNLQSRSISLQDFYVTVANKSISQIDYLLTHSQRWSLVTINFILSSRNDLVLDYFAINLNQQVSKNLIVQIKPKYQFLKFTCKIFLNGYQTNSSLKRENMSQVLDISVSLVSFSQQNLQMDFTGGLFRKINKIYLSYVMIQTVSNEYISDQGSINIQNLKGVQSRDLQGSFIQSQYKLYGINTLNFTGGSLALISSIRSDLTSTIYSASVINSLVIDYIVLSNHPKNICNCEDNKVLKYSFNNSCVINCPQNTFPYTYPEGGYVCLLKPPQVTSHVMNKVLNNNPVIISQQQIQNISLTSQQIANTTKNQPTHIILLTDTCDSQIKNTYFDGKKCSCIPGYKNVSTQCISISTPINLTNINNSTILNLSCSNFNEVNLNGTCICISGYQRVNNSCILKQNITCDLNSFLNNNQCICFLGYTKTINNGCQLMKNISQITCPLNQINNGLNVCICQIGYFNITGVCIKEKPCPINSVKNQDGNCTCKPNYFNISGLCTICPQGQYWLSTLSKCVDFCGQNSIKNNSTGKCQCIPTFGISKQNTCQFCPPNKFILNNYCVSCPQNQYYDQILGKCQCSEQSYMQIDGSCIQKCPNNQYFDIVDKVCKCLSTFGRLNGFCQLCPNNYYVKEFTQQCLSCGEGSVSINGKCVCKSDYGVDIYGKCVSCSSLPNTFMYKGRCSTCAGQKIYNGTSCVCPVGTVFRSLKCIKICQVNELMDEKGNCYKCPLNEIAQNNQCVCKKSYQRINDTCQLICPSGSFVFKDRCSVCPDGKVFDSQINGCICPNGLYLNLYNQCQRLSVSLIQCPLGQFMDMVKGCSNCISSCEKCSNNFTCTKCQLPYFLANDKCKDICGNGIVQTGQQCDDRNLFDNDGCGSTCNIQKNYKCVGMPSICNIFTPQIKCGNGMIQTAEQCDDNNTLNNDGCSSLCAIQRMYSCYGQPSTCRYNSTFHICGNQFVESTEQCDDGNFINGDGCNQNCLIQTGYLCINQPSVCTKSITTGLVLYSKVNYNLNNIYITLQTDQKYQFSSNSEMENFIKPNFINSTYKPSTYCTQREYPELDIFDCLLLYSSGVPNKSFKLEFSYTSPVNGKIVQLQIDIDPLAAQTDRIKNLRRT